MDWNRNLKLENRKWLALTSLVLLLVVIGVFGGGRAAKADPHAVFYTAIGQQQLFFNVLAALDQADFVEPKSGEFGREQLISERGGVSAIPPFTAEQNRLITSTETDLSSIITRPITLGGHDLYTDYLVRQLAIESNRSAGTELLAFAQCENVFGKFNCGEAPDLGSVAGIRDGQVKGITSEALAAEHAEPGTPEFYETQQKAAGKEYVLDALEYGSRWFLNGSMAAMMSGLIGGSPDNEIDKDFREGAADEEKNVNAEKEPLAYSVDLAAWRIHNRETRSGINEIGHNALIDWLVVNTLNPLLSGNFWGGSDDKSDSDRLGDSFPYENVVFKENGRIEINPELTLTDSVTRAMLSLNAPDNLNKIAAAGASRVELQQLYGEADGAKPKIKLKDWAGLNLYKPVKITENEGELSQTYGGPAAEAAGAAEAASSYSYSRTRSSDNNNPEVLTDDGEAELPNTGDSSGGTSSSGLSAALNADAEFGQVAGVKRALVSPNINQRYSFQEPGQAALLRKIIDDPETLRRLGVKPCSLTFCPN